MRQLVDGGVSIVFGPDAHSPGELVALAEELKRLNLGAAYVLVDAMAAQKWPAYDVDTIMSLFRSGRVGREALRVAVAAPERLHGHLTSLADEFLNTRDVLNPDTKRPIKEIQVFGSVEHASAWARGTSTESV